MCGIYGLVELNSIIESGPQILARMGEAMFHRGPDDFGHYFGRGVALGMRRLSIIDVAGGHQPISNENETVWVILNGEIYNFQQLRADLEHKGHRFRTRTDTEIIAHLYEEEGLGFFLRLRGMFGLALWDAKRERLVLGRDRIGEKPLYVRRETGRLLFASELKAILQVQGASREIDLEALREYLSLGYVPAPRSLVKGVQKLLPGHYMVIEKGRIQDREYWDLPIAQPEKQPEEEWIERIRAKLIETVRAQLISDVPLGAFLSGGIDSSAIVATMARLTGKPVKTYSIGYEGDYTYYNELPYAKQVAQAFGTEHHEIVVHPDVGELLPKLVWHLDEPIADSAFLTTYLISRLARESVTVILSGVGGDELFGGYRRYLGDSVKHYYRLLPKIVRTKWLPSLLQRLPQDRHSLWKDYVRYAREFVSTAELDSATCYEGYMTLFSPAAQRELMGPDSEGALNDSAGKGTETLRKYFERAEGDDLNRILYLDAKTSLPDDLLALTDRMSMAASIECRAPLVDFELVELASSMPSSMKVRGFSLKYLMKKAVAPWLPKEIVKRKKRGFGAPMGAWLRRDLQPLVRELLCEEQVRRRGLFDWPTVQNVIADHERERRDNTDRLFALIVLETWCRIYLDDVDWKTGGTPVGVCTSASLSS